MATIPYFHSSVHNSTLEGSEKQPLDACLISKLWSLLLNENWWYRAFGILDNEIFFYKTEQGNNYPVPHQWPAEGYVHLDEILIQFRASHAALFWNNCSFSKSLFDYTTGQLSKWVRSDVWTIWEMHCYGKKLAHILITARPLPHN